MQLLKCSVFLSGQRTHNIQRGVRGEWTEGKGKEAVKHNDYATPAEVVVLRALHGSDAVPNEAIEVMGMDKRSHIAERDRLRGIYTQKIVDQCFPGFNPRLPVTMEDIASEAVPTIILDNEIGTGTMLASV